MVKLALDFDGVLSHTMEAWCSRYNQLRGAKPLIDISHIKKWNFFEDLNMPMDRAFEIFDYIWNNWKYLKPLEHDQNYKVKALNNLVDVDIVTSVHEEHRESISNWLKIYGIKYGELIFHPKKYELDYPFFIDDSPSNAEKISGKGNICLLYNQTWNRHIEGKNIYRVYNLDHALDTLKEIILGVKI